MKSYILLRGAIVMLALGLISVLFGDRDYGLNSMLSSQILFWMWAATQGE